MWLQDLLTLSSWHHTPNAGILNLLNEMATHSSVLAWRIPRTGEPSGLPSLGSHRVRHDWSKLAAAAAAAAAIRLSVQSLSHFWLFETSWTAARQASLSINNSWSLLKFKYVHWVGDAIQPSHSLSSPSPPAFNFPESGSFPKSQFYTSGGESFRVSASASVLPKNIQGWFPLGWTSWIFLQSKGLSRVFSNTKA